MSTNPHEDKSYLVQDDNAFLSKAEILKWEEGKTFSTDWAGHHFFMWSELLQDFLRPERKQRLRSIFDRPPAQFVQASDLRLSEAEEAEVGVRFAAPPAQSLVEQEQCLVRATFTQVLRGVIADATESRRVDVFRRRIDHVTGRLCHQHVVRRVWLGARGQCSPQLRNVDLDRPVRIAGWRAIPHELGQSIVGHDLAGFDQENGKDGSLPQTLQGQELAVPSHLHRSQHAKVEDGQL